MSRISKTAKTPPAAIEKALKNWGNNIYIARMRRGMRLQDLADRIGISRFLMSDIEKGKPSAAVSYYLSALWAMGLLETCSNIGDPDQDPEGKILERAHAPKRASKKTSVLINQKGELDNDF